MHIHVYNSYNYSDMVILHVFLNNYTLSLLLYRPEVNEIVCATVKHGNEQPFATMLLIITM